MVNRRFLPEDLASRMILGLALAILLGLLLGLVIEVLWNHTIAASFGAGTITFWQAVGLFILAKLFFGFGGGHGRSRRRRRRHKESQEDVIADLADDETFKRYWNQAGRQAYEEFRASQSEPQ